MKGKTGNWETELWNYISLGDGTGCPLHDYCLLRQKGVRCLSDAKEYIKRVIEVLDDDTINLNYLTHTDFYTSSCTGSSRIFRLVRKLARKYRDRNWTCNLPVPDNLILKATDNLPIEVRSVPLRAYHGATWRLSDCWVVQLNSNDLPARKRFTLYHEIFHILAHCKATPVFQKKGSGREGYFNEILADHFAGIILMPQKWLVKKWAETKDLDQMAAIFDVPKQVMWFSLNRLRLI